MVSKVPFVILNDGNKCPILGLGTWKSQLGEVTQAVMDAIDVGYRHFDCAHVYRNEQEVGKALEAKIKEGVVKREDLFITSKLWNTCHKKESVLPAVKLTLKNLGLAYLDLYLIHWPCGYEYKDSDVLFPRDSGGKILHSDSHFTETWKGMEECVKKGLVKSIGLSNFNSEQVKEIMVIAEIKPVTNQVECHIYLNQEKLIHFCKQYGITITAYSPLGSPDRPGAKEGDPAPLKDPKVDAIAEKYGKSPAQVLIKFQIQRNVIVIPKTVTKSRIMSNFDVFDFEMSKQEMEELMSLNFNGRLLRMEWDEDHKYYPFKIEF